MIKTIENKYNGVIIDIDDFFKNTEKFYTEIVKIIDSSINKDLLWIKIPVEKSEYIPILTKLGFEFHHCDEKNLMLVKMLKQEAFIPTTKNFIVGVGAIVFYNGKLLTIKDKFSLGYKLPGGHIDKNESIKDALKREVDEETGIKIEFESILNIGHFRNGQFGEANLYIVCTAKALTDKIMIKDLSEILEAKWINTEEFINSDEVNIYNKSIVMAAMNNKELKLKEQKIKLRDPSGEVFF